MKTKELLKLIEKGESETLEFKSSLSRVNEIVEAVSALANAKGGKILAGISDSGKIQGIEVGKDTIERITNKIVGNTDPKIYPTISVEGVDGGRIITIEVKEAVNRPVLAFGRAFKRVGKSTLKMTRDEYERTILEKHREELRFDTQICKGASLEDIDEEKVGWYLKKRAEARGIEIPKLPFKQTLINLDIAIKKDDELVPTNAGVLFFGKYPQKFAPFSEVKIARFKGTTMTEFIDRAELQGTVPELIDEAEKFVKRNTRRATKIVEFEQVNIPEYPYEAIREAITNAVTHRDYLFSGASVRVMIFDDRIEVESPGRLPEGVTLKNLEGSHVLRNEKIANLLYDITYIEKWGTGIRRMKDLMLRHGLKDPVFEERDSFFKAAFYGPGEEILDLVPSIPKERRVNLKEFGLNDRQIEALRLMVNEGEVITNKRYRELFNVTDRTALRDLGQLARKRLIVREGSKRDARYVKR